MCLLFGVGALSAVGGGPKDAKKDPKDDQSDREPVRIRGRQKAPEFADISAWINSEPLTMEKLKAPKRPYTPPRLIVYGDVRTLTRENGPHVLKDGSNNARGNRT